MELPEWMPPRGDDGMWGPKEVAAAAGVGESAYGQWRWRDSEAVEAGLEPGRDWVRRLPVEEDTRPAGRGVHPVPRWSPEVIVRHLRQTGRMDADLRPVRVRGQPTSRARATDGRFTGGGDREGRQPEMGLAINPNLAPRDRCILILQHAEARGWLTYEGLQAGAGREPDEWTVVMPSGARLLLLGREPEPFVVGVAAAHGIPQAAVYRDGIVEDEDR